MAPTHTKNTVGRNTASAAIIAREKNGNPSSTAIPACSSIIAPSSTFLIRRLNTVNGNATCTATVPYDSSITSVPLPATTDDSSGHGVK